MTLETFQRLAASGIVLLDGAMGSNLRQAGMPVGVCGEQWALAHREVVQALQMGYVEAGSQIIYAPSFSANRLSLRRFGLEDEADRLNRELVHLTQEAVQGRAYVAGDMTTTGEPLAPTGTLAYQELFDAYREQAEALAEAGADLLVAETLLGVDEAVAVLDAARDVCDLPVLCTLTLQADGTAYYGGTGVEAVTALQDLGAAAVGVNCSVGPDQLEAVIGSMHAVAEIPLIAKPNAGIPAIDSQGEAVYPMGPDSFAGYMLRLVDAGATIIGGCCGTTPAYISTLRARLEERTAGNAGIG